MLKVGIDDISLYTPAFYLDLKTLAKERGVDPIKYSKGIGQELMAFPSPDEDIVTMAANAALPLLERCAIEEIGTMLFATETSVDQSKAAGIFVHDLLGLKNNCRVVEMKQACYSATAALQSACALVARNPEKAVMVIASDIAKYDLESPGESTQGAGAVAMIVRANPRILEISATSGCFCQNVEDFWRPNYRQTPVVDGRYSTQVYIKAAQESWLDLIQNCDLQFDDINYFCYHLPFTKMGLKAHRKVARVAKSAKSVEQLEAQLAPADRYNRQVGNCYTASIYISLCSLLDNIKEDMANEKIALFSFGSGCVGEFFWGTVVPGYKQLLRTKRNIELLQNRKELSFEEYLRFYKTNSPDDGLAHSFDKETTGHFYLSALENHHRIYSS